MFVLATPRRWDRSSVTREIWREPVPSSTRRLVGVISAACALGIVGAVSSSVSSASAALVDLGLCNTAALSQPFIAWGDWADYELAPGGDFESSTWALVRGAQIVPGGEPYGTPSSAQSSLSLPAGAAAQSPLTCVNASYPTIRFFISGSGAVAVEVVADGLPIPTGIAIATGNWRPTSIMMTDAAVAGVLARGTAFVSLRLVALSGDPHVDDLYIDPWNRG